MFRKFNKTIEICKYIKNESRFLSAKPKTIANKDDEKSNIQKQILQESLGLSYSQSARLVRENKFFKNLKNNRLLSTVHLLQKLGLSREDITKNPQPLSYIDSSIEQNVLHLQEIGFLNVDCQMLTKFRSIVRKPISKLKLHGFISENTNVVEELCSYLNPMLITKISIDEFSDEQTVLATHEAVFKKYFVHILQATEQETNRIFKIYDGFRYISFRLVSEMVNLLIEELDFTHTKILQHGYLMETNPNAVRRIMETFPKLGNVEIKQVFFKYPKLMTLSVENIQQILKHIKDFGISEDAIQKCYDIFTLAPDSILNRLNELKNVPEFEVLIKNPRVLILLLFQNKAKMRLELLRNMNVKCASLHVLCATDTVFEKYTQDGSDRTKGTDLVNYLAVELNRSFQEIRDSLTVNQHWYHIPTTSVRNSLVFLQEMEFSTEDIAQVAVLLLYPKDQIEETLKEVNAKLNEMQRNPTSLQKLNLCLYTIEKKFHFSGNGLWSKNDTNGEQNQQRMIV